MKKAAIAAAVLAAGILLWHFGVIQKVLPKNLLSKVDTASISDKVENIGKQIFAPPPLRSSSSDNGTLTAEGVISWTNTNRAENGSLAALRENSVLDKEAQAKVADMFKQQYFEHVNPQGHGPDYLAQQAGYEYISIGENLALGNFKDDEALVTGWMNSPGHRANILNKNFEEIGVAVGRGMYEGKMTWLSVQEFGRPASSCPQVDPNLKARIDFTEMEVKQTQPQLQSLKSQMDSSNPQTKEQYDAYNQLVAQYNALVKIYNNKVDSLKAETDQYNAEVKNYNACASG